MSAATLRIRKQHLAFIEKAERELARKVVMVTIDPMMAPDDPNVIIFVHGSVPLEIARRMLQDALNAIPAPPPQQLPQELDPGPLN